MSDACRRSFPVRDGRLVLLNEARSVFRAATIDQEESPPGAGRRLRAAMSRLLPSITRNWVAPRNFARMARLLESQSSNPTVLVVGAGESGVGCDVLGAPGGIEVVATDIYLGAQVALVADGHDLPFLDGSMDGVVVQAVLEHVLDPQRCVAEIHRVLKPGGIVYAETPFMYPVHLAAHDFMRFSPSAHRRLFRDFEAIDAGLAAGPGQALALAARGFVLSWSSSRTFRRCAGVLLPFLLFWLKYTDGLLMRQPHAADFASTSYFLGRKADQPITDEAVVASHWSRRAAEGAQP
jgi:SAM-dependent methyltransferase